MQVQTKTIFMIYLVESLLDKITAYSCNWENMSTQTAYISAKAQQALTEKKKRSINN